MGVEKRGPDVEEVGELNRGKLGHRGEVMRSRHVVTHEQRVAAE